MDKKGTRIFIAICVVAGAIVVVVANSHKVKIQLRRPAASGPAQAAVPPNSQAVQNETEDILDRVRPCVVSVVSYVDTIIDHQDPSSVRLLDPYQKGKRVISSGIIINRDGVILTTKNAVPSRQIEVKLYRRVPNVFKADIIMVDEPSNLALLQAVEGTGFPVCRLGDSDLISVGDIVYAVGSPYGFASTVTSGIVSSTRRKLTAEGLTFRNVIQTDAMINDGNSGGPLINIRGEVIGINAAMYSENAADSGIGFAIPVNDAKGFLRRALP